MTNKHKKFTPTFSEKKEQKPIIFNQLIENIDGEKKPDINKEFLDDDLDLQTILNDNDGSNKIFNNEDKKPNSIDGITFGDDDFDKLLLEANALVEGTTYSLPSLSDDEDSTPLIDGIDSEVREEIYTDGYMQGSLDQKEVMDKRLAKLQETVKSLEMSSLTPDILSKQINDAISSLIKEIACSVLSEIKSNLLSDVIESRVSEFVSEVKGWGLVTLVYCSVSEYDNLLEIFSKNEKAEKVEAEESGLVSFSVNNVKYVKDQDLLSGGFRIEIERDGGGKIESVMNIDSHIKKIEETLLGVIN